MHVFKKGFKSALGNLVRDKFMPEKMATIPFDEIAAGSSARVCVIENMQHLSVRDILMHVCSLSTVRANEKWRLLPDEVKNEVAEFLGNFQFPGKGNKSEPVITFKGALKLVMMISGEKAALYRSSMAKILTRYYAGDGSLLEEVEANAQSTHLINSFNKSCHQGTSGVKNAPDSRRTESRTSWCVWWADGQANPPSSVVSR